MIQELLDYYFENRVAASQAKFITMDQMKEELTYKLDKSLFDDHVRRQIVGDATAENRFIVNDRLSKIERNNLNFVTKEEHHREIDLRATNESLSEMGRKIEDLREMLGVKSEQQQAIVQDTRANYGEKF